MISLSCWFDNSFQFLELYLGVDIVFLCYGTCMYDVCRYMHVCGGQRPTFANLFSVSTKNSIYPTEGIILSEKKKTFLTICAILMSLFLYSQY